MSEPNPPAVPPVQKREIFGWCCFDFANSAFTTVVITVVGLRYFKAVIAEGNPDALGWWGFAISSSQIIVLAVSPLVGAIADVTARKKPFLLAAAMVCSAATAGLFWVGVQQVALALALVMVANIAFSLSENLCAAFLPEISTPENAGRISAYGWSFGYCGGLVTMVLAVAILKIGGSSLTAVTFLMTGAFFLLASLPTLLLLRERARPRALAVGETYFSRGWRQLAQMRHDLPQHRALALFFVALTLYMAGLTAVFSYAAEYAESTVGMSGEEVLVLFCILQIAGVIGAFGFGYLQDRTSAKLVLTLALVMWIGGTIWAAYCTTKTEFYVIGTIAGAAMGAVQSAGRAVVSTLTPAGRSGEFFGYWGFFVKLATVIGVATYAHIASTSGQRTAVLVTTGFFAAGLLVLTRVKLPSRPAN